MLHYFHKIGWRRNKERKRKIKNNNLWPGISIFALSLFLTCSCISAKKKRMETTKRLKKFNLGLKNIDEEEKYNQITKYR